MKGQIEINIKLYKIKNEYKKSWFISALLFKLFIFNYLQKNINYDNIKMNTNIKRKSIIIKIFIMAK